MPFDISPFRSFESAQEKLQYLMVLLAIDQDAREHFFDYRSSVIAQIDNSAEFTDTARTLSRDQFLRFHEIIIGTRRASLFAALSSLCRSQEDETLLKRIIDDFLRSTVIPDGRSDLDIRLLDEYTARNYPASVIATLLTAQVARLIATSGSMAMRKSPLSLVDRVYPVALNCEYSELNSLEERHFLECLGSEPYYYVVLSADNRTLFAEVDAESFSLLSRIDLLNRTNSHNELRCLLRENYDLIRSGVEDGILLAETL